MNKKNDSIFSVRIPRHAFKLISALKTNRADVWTNQSQRKVANACVPDGPFEKVEVLGRKASSMFLDSDLEAGVRRMFHMHT